MAINSTTPAQRRYVKKPPVKHNEQAYRMAPVLEEAWDRSYEAAPDWLKPVVGGAASFQRFSDQLQKNVVSGVMQIPTDVAGMIDLIRIGVPAVLTNLQGRGTGDPEDIALRESFGQRVMEAFTRGVFSDEAQANLNAHIQEKAREFAAAKPDATPEQLGAFLDEYQNTQEFFDFMTGQMSPGFRLAQYGNQFANDFVRLGKRPDQQTMVDDIGQIFGQSVIGLPSSVIRKLGDQARKAVGDAVFDSATGKIVLKGTELLTPLTLPHTPGNVAANFGVGAGLTELTRSVSGLPSVLNGEIAEFVTELDPPDGHGINVDAQIDNATAAAGVSLAGLFAFPAFRRQATNSAIDAATKAVRDLNTTSGSTLREQSGALDPLLQPITGLADANAPVKKGANLFDADTETLDLLDANMSSASTINRVEAEIRAVNYGILDGMPNGTIPLIELQRAARQLAPEDYDLLNKYFYASARQHGDQIAEKSLRDAYRDAQMDFQAARARSDTRATIRLREKMVELEQQLVDIQRDIPTTRSAMQDWSRADVQNVLDVAKRNPAVMQVAQGMEKVFRDIIEFKKVNGLIDGDEALRLLQDGVLLMRERAYPNVTNPIARRGLLLKDRIFGRQKDLSYEPNDPNLAINKPKDSLVTLQEGLMEAVRDVAANNARRMVVDTLKKLPGAEGNLLRQFQFDIGGGRKVGSLGDKQFAKIGREQIAKRRDQFVHIVRDGKHEFWEFSDPSITKSLQFAPLATVPIMNATRKMWQATTTGLAAPWFALKSALWDVPIARTTSRQGRSLGLIDTYARKLFNESPTVNAVMDHVPDPTAWASAALAIPYQLSMRAARAVGQKIASDLANNNGFFNLVAQMPGGEQWLTQIGTNMSKAFDRSVFNVYSRNLSTTLSHLTDAATIADDYIVKGKGTALGAGFRSTINMYKAMVESVQNSTRMAFFVENYSRLQAKHNGRVPKKELAKLVQETRNLTGDMSRTSNSKFIQGLTSVIPYGNPIIQGTRHMLGSMVPPIAAKGINKLTRGKANMLENRTNKFWSQYIGGMLLPTLGAMAIVDQWPGMQDWWYNKVPEWERGAVLPFPTYEALEYLWENGEWPAFDPKYVHKLPIAPEFTMVNAPITAALRSMGVYGPASSHLPSSFGSQMAASFEQLTGFATPPALQALAAYNGGRLDLRAGLSGQGFFQDNRNLTFGGANANNTTWNSDMPKVLYDVIGALTSSTGMLVAQTWNVFDIASEQGDDFGEAFSKAMETAGYELQQKLPHVPGLPGLSQNYAFTPESEFVFNTERTLDPLIGSGRQRSVELDSKDRVENLEAQGLIPPNKIKEPLLREMQEVIYSALMKKGPYKQAGDQYTELRVELNALEASRAKWPEQAYHDKHNELVAAQQQLKAIQSRLLVNLQSDLNDKYGRVFQQIVGAPFTYQTLVEAVKRDVGQ